jgi:hypothetical protein
MAKDDGFNKWRNPNLNLKTKNERLGMKYAKRREMLKKAKNPMIQLGRAWKKASTWGKVGIGAAALAPKAILIGVGYLGAKSGAKKNGKEQPKKYMVG